MSRQMHHKDAHDIQMKIQEKINPYRSVYIRIMIVAQRVFLPALTLYCQWLEYKG